MTRAAAGVLLVVGLLVGVSAPASASSSAGGTVELSVDGTTWSQNLVADLFGQDLVWVPGEVDTATLYVRTTCSSASGHADVTVGPDDARLASVMDVRTRVDGGTWAGPSSAPFTVALGQVARLDVEVTYDPAATATSQRRSAPLAVAVAVSCGDGATGPAGTQPGPVATGSALAPPPAASTGPASHLASTGATVLSALVVALMLVLAGTGLAALRRSRAPEGPDA